MSQNLPVLIVGAGPAGLILALTLLKNGIRIRIVDKNRIPHGGARGTAIQPRSLELLAFLGVVDDVFEISTPPLLMTINDTDKQIVKTTQWAEEAEQSPSVPYPRVASASQAQLEKVLRKHIEQLGGRVEFGTEVVSVSQDSDKVVARLVTSSTSGEIEQEEITECEYLVATDGARSRIRKEIGLAFLGETREAERIFVANVDGDGVDREHWHMWGSLKAGAIGLKPLKPAPLFQVQAFGSALPAVLPEDAAGIQELFNSISGTTHVQLSNATWVSTWTANIRMVNTFNVGRVFLAGDCAHSHSPAGGQGANTAMQDSFNLAWKLALVIRRLASPSLLKTYDIERMPVIAEMLNLSTELHALTFNRNQASALEAGPTADSEQAMFRPKRLLQLGINCRWSPIVVEDRTASDEPSTKDPYGEATEKLRAGDRAPDATHLADASRSDVKDTFTLHSMLSVDRHTVLVFPHHVESPDTNGLVKALEDHARLDLTNAILIVPPQSGIEKPTMEPGRVRIVIDIEGHARAGYDAPPDRDSFVVIRPDGIIGAYTHDITAASRYFTAVLA